MSIYFAGKIIASSPGASLLISPKIFMVTPKKLERKQAKDRFFRHQSDSLTFQNVLKKFSETLIHYPNLDKLEFTTKPGQALQPNTATLDLIGPPPTRGKTRIELKRHCTFADSEGITNVLNQFPAGKWLKKKLEPYMEKVCRPESAIQFINRIQQAVDTHFQATLKPFSQPDEAYKTWFPNGIAELPPEQLATVRDLFRKKFGYGTLSLIDPDLDPGSYQSHMEICGNLDVGNKSVKA